MLVRGRFQFSLGSLLALLTLSALAAGGIALMPAFWAETLLLASLAAGLVIVLQQTNPLLFYLRYLNPVLALLVLVICVYAGTVDEGQYKGLFQEPIGSYFAGKGLFCALAICLLGKILEVLLRLASRLPAPEESGR
ncbi:hypothetical protein [Lignipirellula cremea]|nr:hypothetical protein [Lignipirellula cremea]